MKLINQIDGRILLVAILSAVLSGLSYIHHPATIPISTLGPAVLYIIDAAKSGEELEEAKEEAQEARNRLEELVAGEATIQGDLTVRGDLNTSGRLSEGTGLD